MTISKSENKYNQSRFFVRKLGFFTAFVGLICLSLLPSHSFAASPGNMDGFIYADSSVTTSRAPTVVFFNNYLVMSYVKDNNVISNRRCTLNGLNVPTCGAWQDSNGLSPSNVNMAVFNNRLYQTVRGTDNRIYVQSSADGNTWTGWRSNNDGFTLNTPSMTTFKGRLYMSVRGTDNRIYVQSSADGNTWTGWRSNDDGRTINIVGMGANSNELCQTVIGTDGGFRMYTRCSSDGSNWGGWRGEDGASNKPVAVVGVKEGETEFIMLFCVGTDSNIYYKAPSYYGWHGFEQNNRSMDQASVSTKSDNSGVTNAIAVSYRGTDNKIYLEVNYLI